MNRFQIGKQVQALLRAATWTDTGVVFASGSVIVTMGISQKTIAEKRLPVCLVRVGSTNADPDMEEAPGVEGVDVSLAIIVANASDQNGEDTLLGANRESGSTGRGLFEVEEVVKARLLQVGPSSGMPIVFRSSGAAESTLDESLGYIAACDYRFRALGTVARTYQAPSGFARTGTTTAILAWNASTRFDFRRFILRRAAGSTPPATAASGTGVTLGGSPDGAAATGVTDSPGAGVWSYALFAVYDDTDSSGDAATSLAQTLTVTVS